MHFTRHIFIQSTCDVFCHIYFPELLALAAGNRVDNLKTREHALEPFVHFTADYIHQLNQPRL
jgi:hypothetical protein